MRSAGRSASLISRHRASSTSTCSNRRHDPNWTAASTVSVRPQRRNRRLIRSKSHRDWPVRISVSPLGRHRPAWRTASSACSAPSVGRAQPGDASLLMIVIVVDACCGSLTTVLRSRGVLWFRGQRAVRDRGVNVERSSPSRNLASREWWSWEAAEVERVQRRSCRDPLSW